MGTLVKKWINIFAHTSALVIIFTITACSVKDTTSVDPIFFDYFGDVSCRPGNSLCSKDIKDSELIVIANNPEITGLAFNFHNLDDSMNIEIFDNEESLIEYNDYTGDSASSLLIDGTRYNFVHGIKDEARYESLLTHYNNKICPPEVSCGITTKTAVYYYDENNRAARLKLINSLNLSVGIMLETKNRDRDGNELSKMGIVFFRHGDTPDLANLEIAKFKGLIEGYFLREIGITASTENQNKFLTIQGTINMDVDFADNRITGTAEGFTAVKPEETDKDWPAADNSVKALEFSIDAEIKPDDATFQGTITIVTDPEIEDNDQDTTRETSTISGVFGGNAATEAAGILRHQTIHTPADEAPAGEAPDGEGQGERINTLMGVFFSTKQPPPPVNPPADEDGE